MTYHYLPTSVPGFVQQLAVAYIARGYVFYVAGHVPPGKPAEAVDRKLLDRYGIEQSRWQRVRRRIAGRASLQYLRYGRFWIMLATHGQHEFFEREHGVIRDVRREPIAFSGYSIGYRRGIDGRRHVSVRIHPNEYRWLKQFLVRLATHASFEVIEAEFARLRFEPYAPVIRQTLCLLRAVNRVRRTAGLEPVSPDAIRRRRKVVAPFAPLMSHAHRPSE